MNFSQGRHQQKTCETSPSCELVILPRMTFSSVFFQLQETDRSPVSLFVSTYWLETFIGDTWYNSRSYHRWRVYKFHTYMFVNRTLVFRGPTDSRQGLCILFGDCRVCETTCTPVNVTASHRPVNFQPSVALSGVPKSENGYLLTGISGVTDVLERLSTVFTLRLDVEQDNDEDKNFTF